MALGFLHTRVGRRYLAVNLLSAFVPLLVIGGVSYTLVSRELRSQAEDRVTRLSKSLTLTTLASLASLTQDVRTPANSADDGLFTPTLATTRRRVVEEGVPRSLADPAPARALTAEEHEHLTNGRALLVVSPPATEQGDAELLIARAPNATGRRDMIQWRRANPAFLWGSADEAMAGDDAAFCAFEAQTLARVHCSAEMTTALVLVARTQATSASESRRVAELDGFFFATRDVYLTHEFGSRPWRVVVLQRTEVSFAALAPFRRLMILILLAVAILMFVVSHAQIRRTTEPLAAIQQGTRRVQAGDFSRPVHVSSNDEYADVAESFNGMAHTLGRQLQMFSSLDAIDRSALTARDTNSVVQEALGRFTETLSSSRISIALAVPESRGTFEVTTIDPLAPIARTASVTMSADDRIELERHPRQLFAQGPRSWLPPMVTQQAERRVLILPLVHDQELLGAIALGRPEECADISNEVAEARRIADRVAVALSHVLLVRRLDALSAGTLVAFARAIDANSPWTAGHSERVTGFAVVLGRRLGLSAGELEVLQRGGLLHDIGKIAIPPAILDKAARLSDDEWKVMQRHPVIGCEILAPIPGFREALPIVRSHHERMDGTGYPDRLMGDDIPYLARVLAIADVFDALVSNRPYRAGLTAEQACEMIRSESGTHLDPRMVAVFLEAVRDGEIRADISALDSASLAEAVARARSHLLVPA